ncbi:MAG: protein-methionine-sulfoxide reductase catalytic subunit MsrP, partial [Thermohalobaculum sp.]|nr:protein-methionine-sulfoxide reductase catalytic subunit MsrP [Thermohalobaculum sp.]
MPIIRKPRWALPESAATPETVFWNRRAILAAGGGMLAAGALAGLPGRAQAATPGDPFVPLPQANPGFATAGRAITPEAINA